MSQEMLHPLYRQMGAVTIGLQSLVQTIEASHAELMKLHGDLRTDFTALRQDQSEIEEKLDCVICVMQHDLEQLRTGAAQQALSSSQLVDAMKDLKGPVSEMVALRARVGGLLVGLGVLGSVATWLAEPIYKWFIEERFLKR